MASNSGYVMAPYLPLQIATLLRRQSQRLNRPTAPHPSNPVMKSEALNNKAYFSSR